VVGLGNPGPEYHATRHNLGQRVVDRLAERLGGRFRARGPAAVAEVVWLGEPLYLAKPFSFMNVVGGSVKRLLHLYGLGPEALVVVYDDLDLPFGRVRVRHQGRHGGHNGVRSLLDVLGTDQIRRVKVGVGRPQSRDDVVDWLLTPFERDEEAALPEIVERAAQATLDLVTAPAPPPAPAPPA
jgi:PTH1 family peptidyl-tRNA hydrolase